MNNDNLPKEMQEIIGKWTAKSYSDYVDGNDVYGITEDLKVYYQIKDSDNTYKYYGISNPEFSQEKGDQEVFNNNSSMSKLIGGNTVAVARSVTQLDINQNSGINNLNEIYNFVALEKLILSNVEWDTLDGLEYATNVNCIFIQNCKIKDYKSIAKLPKLQYLFLYNADNTEITNLCDNATRYWRERYNYIKIFRNLW